MNQLSCCTLAELFVTCCGSVSTPPRLFHAEIFLPQAQAA
jgi:hypothetical protein